VTVNPGRGLTWSLSGAGISLHGDWSYSKRVLFRVRDHGSFDASASGASISVSVTLGATAAGEPTIRTTGCSCHIDRLKIRLHGGASWLYNLLIGLAENYLRRSLQRMICKAAEEAINMDAAFELETLRVKVSLDEQNLYLLDYRLVSSPTFASGYLESFHKGEFFNAGDPTEAPFQPSPLPSPPTVDRMATFWASSYVLNTAGYVLQKRGILRQNFTKEDLPEQSRQILRTTCGLFSGCIGTFVPAVGKMFPNASVQIEMYSTAPPTAGIDPEKLTGSFAGAMVFRARLSDGSLAHLFGMAVTAKITVAPRLHGEILKANVTSLEYTVALTDSSVGPISNDLLRIVFDMAKRMIIIPKLNEAGEMGLPLPVLKHIRFTNTELKLEHDCLRVSTDAAYSPSSLHYVRH